MSSTEHLHGEVGQKAERRFGSKSEILRLPQARHRELDYAAAFPEQFSAAVSCEIRHCMVLCIVVDNTDTYCDDRIEQGREADEVESSLSEILCQTYSKATSPLQRDGLGKIQQEERYRLS